jgi:hypothetical protein
VDDSQNLAGLGIALDLCLAEIDLRGGDCAAVDVERVGFLREIVAAGNSFFTTGRCVEFVQ